MRLSSNKVVNGRRRNAASLPRKRIDLASSNNKKKKSVGCCLLPLRMHLTQQPPPKSLTGARRLSFVHDPSLHKETASLAF
jgi:hypothetical protein